MNDDFGYTITKDDLKDMITKFKNNKGDIKLYDEDGKEIGKVLDLELYI